MVINGQNDKSLIEGDEQLTKSSAVVSDLQSWFPQLQAAIEENEKTWSSLGYNMKKVASTSQEIYGEGCPMQIMLEGLQVAGSKVIKPDASDNLLEERAKSAADLRAFNERIRGLRMIQEECVQTMKNKAYYQEKVETMRKKENEKAAKRSKSATEKEAEKRLRNEQKLTEVSTKLLTQIDNLSRELEVTVVKKEEVLARVLNCYIHTQNYFFARNPMPVVLANMPSIGSPQSVHDGGHGYLSNAGAGFPPDYIHGYSLASAPSRSDVMDGSAKAMVQPPRAPSPDMYPRVLSHSPSEMPTQGYNPLYVPCPEFTISAENVNEQHEAVRRRSSLISPPTQDIDDQPEFRHHRSSLESGGRGTGITQSPNTHSIYPSVSVPQSLPSPHQHHQSPQTSPAPAQEQSVPAPPGSNAPEHGDYPAVSNQAPSATALGAYY